MQYDSGSSRIWELDLLRGIALILMIYFHIIFDMGSMYGYKINYNTGINSYIGEASAVLFILISGVSCQLSRNNIKRGLKLLGLAMVITLITHFYNPSFDIKFGILHFLGICVILSAAFKRLNRYLLIGTGTAVILFGSLTARINVTNDYFFALGLYSDKFVSLDYYPLIPWLGVFLYGMALGKLFYAQRKSIFKFTLKDNIISRAGRHTLICYMLHQPAIIGILFLAVR